MGFTGCGAVCLLCGLVFFPTSGGLLALCAGDFFAAERGIFWPGGEASFGVVCRIFDNLVLKKEKRGRRGLVRARRILDEGSRAVKETSAVTFF